jgi:hypothetical protein
MGEVVSLSASKHALQAFIAEAISTGVTEGWSIDNLKGIALYNPVRDAPLVSLNSFDAATKGLSAIPNFIGTLDRIEVGVVLQFIYQYFSRIDSIRYEEAVFEDLWRDLRAEIRDAYWVVRGVANLRNFQSDKYLIDLGDGVTIRGRDPVDLASLGFGDAVWERLAADWHGPGASSFVLVAEHFFVKRPDNTTELNSSSVWEKVQRAIWALRLAEAGSISISEQERAVGWAFGHAMIWLGTG